jgi:hypothetical protein
MRIFINQRDVGQVAPAGATVGEMVEAARVHVDPGEIVVAVNVGGRRYQAGEDDRYLRRSAAGIVEMVLDTQQPAAFAADKRRRLADASVVIAAKVRRVAMLLRGADERAGNSLLAALMEELRLALLLDQQLATLEGTRPSAARDEIRTLAPEMLTAQERREWRSLASLLEERLAPILEQWGTELGGAATSVS